MDPNYEAIEEKTAEDKKDVSQNGEPDPSLARKVGQSYWSLVKHQYRKNKLAVVAIYVVALLIFVAIFADFLANNKPIYTKYNGGHIPYFQRISCKIRDFKMADRAVKR
jgi:hypothetical protein